MVTILMRRATGVEKTQITAANRGSFSWLCLFGVSAGVLRGGGLSYPALGSALRLTTGHKSFLARSRSLYSSGIVHRQRLLCRAPLSTVVPHIHRRTNTNMAKLECAPAERNKDPIWQILESRVLTKILAPQENAGALPSEIRVLEVAAGTGIHVQYFTSKLSKVLPTSVILRYQPTDADPSYRASQDAYLEDANFATTKIVVEPSLPLTLDTQGIQELATDAAVKLLSPLDLVININMIHISPWTATVGLLRMASQSLKPGGYLLLYGPYRENGTCVESNQLSCGGWLCTLFLVSHLLTVLPTDVSTNR
jgi:SAM-dependent methyltransferase